MRRVEIAIDSVRQWIATCRGNDPDDPSVTNAMVKKLVAKDIAPLFAPMRFVGWQRYLDGAFVTSPLAKHRSSAFIFEVDGGDASSHWRLDEIASYLGPARREVPALDAAKAT